MPERWIKKIAYLQEITFLRVFGLTMCIISIHMPKCNCSRAPSLFNVAGQNISDCANMSIRPYGIIPSICSHTGEFRDSYIPPEHWYIPTIPRDVTTHTTNMDTMYNSLKAYGRCVVHCPLCPAHRKNKFRGSIARHCNDFLLNFIISVSRRNDSDER